MSREWNAQADITQADPPNNDPTVTKVGAPPVQTLVEEFTLTMKETLFADNLFHRFKDQLKSRRFLLGLQSVPYLRVGEGQLAQQIQR